MEPEQAASQPITNPAPPSTASTPVPQPDKHKLPSAFSLFGSSLRAWKINIKTSVLLSLLIFIPIFGLVTIALAQAYYRSNTNGSSASLNITSAALGILCGLLIIFIGIVSIGAFYKVQLDSARGQKIGLKEAFRLGRHYGIKIIGLSILMAIVIAVGFLLLIIPGLFMMRRYYLAPFYLVDKDMGIMEAMKASAADSKPFSAAIWGLIGVTFLMAILSTLPVIGIIASLLPALYSFAPAVRYTQIQNALGNTPAAAATIS
jgi:uncharacterized membrane protein